MQAVYIKGRSQQQLSVSTTAAQTNPLPGGIYDIWSDVDIYIKTEKTSDNVTTSSGYLISAGNVIPVMIDDGDRIGAIAGASGTMRYHQTA